MALRRELDCERRAHQATQAELAEVRQSLEAKLQEQTQRYHTALRSSKVTVSTQDRDLRYTSISGSFFGRSASEIIGRCDSELLPAAQRDAIVAIKRETLASGEPRTVELAVDEGGRRLFELYIEPTRDIHGEIVGLTCAAVDVTTARDNEAHLRMLMRELTHRSKNLLAVIQAMARQTARHADTKEIFLDRFSARLQAIATSHDLLIQGGWQGVPLEELIRSQLGSHIERQPTQITLGGPKVLLKPDAAQGLGLAMHELASNAARYGALSVGRGRVRVGWTRMPASDGHGLELTWHEEGGPPVPPSPPQGFGTMVVQRHLARVLDSDVALNYAPSGVQCRIVVPVTHFIALR